MQLDFDNKMKIPLMELTRQYKSIEKNINIKVLDVLRSGNYILGKEVETFENEFAKYIGTRYAVGVGNGTDALVIALKAAGIQAGDEVITSAMSFIATAEAIVTVGAIPIFVDCDIETYTIKVENIVEKISSKTKAIIPVHLYGQCANMNEIKKIAITYDLIIIEDCAQSTGASNNNLKAGSIGDIGCFSFFPTKNLGCAGDGGIITTNSEDLYRKCRAYRMHGGGIDGLYCYESINGKTDNIDFSDNLPKYFNFVPGYNSRLDEIQATILNIKLLYLDEWNRRRKYIAEKYYKQIDNIHIKLPFLHKNNKHVYYTFILLVDDRNRFKRYLNNHGIATGVYFPIPLHLQKVFKNLSLKKGDMPNSEYIAEHGIAIPIFPELYEEEINFIISVINNYN